MFWDRFVSECNRIGKKPNPVAKECDISSGTVTGWKKGSIPNTDCLSRLSEYFGCSSDYLLGATEIRNSEPNLSNLTEQEKTLLKLFRDTTEEGRLEMIASFTNIRNSKEKKNTTVNSENAG